MPRFQTTVGASVSKEEYEKLMEICRQRNTTVGQLILRYLRRLIKEHGMDSMEERMVKDAIVQ